MSSMVNDLKLSDAQIIFWACCNLYQFTDTQEEAFELARYFAEHVGLKHEFPEIDAKVKDEETTAETAKQSDTTEESEAAPTGGTPEKHEPSVAEIVAALKQTGAIK